MEYFVTSQPEMQPIVDYMNKKIDEKGYISMDDLTGNKDRIHGLVFPTQEEADKYKDAYHALFPNENEEWK